MLLEETVQSFVHSFTMDLLKTSYVLGIEEGIDD